MKQRARIYLLRATRFLRQTCAKLATPTTVSSAYVWFAMGGAALTLAHGIRSFDFLHPVLVVLYAVVFAAMGTFEKRQPHLEGLTSTFMLVAAVQLSLSETLTLALFWYGVQWFGNRRRNLHTLIVQGAFLIVSVGSVNELVHAPVLVKVLAIKATIAALCYFAMNYLSALVIQSFDREGWTGWRHHVAFGSWFLQAAFVGLLGEIMAETKAWTPLVAIVGSILLHRWFHSDSLKTINHSEELAALHLRTIEALALAIEAKDHTTHDHLRRVKVYATELGKDLKVTPLELEALGAAALLHDIGKLAVPEHIISKPGKLTREEFEKMKIHPTVGAEILERVEFPYPVAPIVAAHHEHWDGTGYPRGLAGEQIPIGARIISAVDCLDALATDRQYRRALPLDDAMKVLVAESGKSFDPQVVALLHRRYIELEELAKGEAKPVLSSEVVVERGDAPAAGFEVGAESAVAGKSGGENLVATVAAAYQESQLLFGMARSLKQLTLQEILSILAVRVKAIVPYDGFAVYLRNGDVLEPAFVTGDDSRLFGSLRIPMGEGLSGWVAENNKPILNGNPSVEPGYLNNPTIVSMLQAALAAPLEGSEGVIGVIALYHKGKDVFTSNQLHMLEAIGESLAVFVESDTRTTQAEARYSIDMLTGLPTARALVEHLDREIKRCRAANEALRVLICNVDDFKLVNDRFGRLTGDRVLVLLADTFRNLTREVGYVARMEGDQFAVVLAGVTEATIDALTGRLCAAACEIGWSVCRADLLRLSSGVAILPPQGAAPAALLREAEHRMLRIKRNRKSGAEPMVTSSLQDDLCTLESRPSISLKFDYAASVTDKTA